MRAIAIAWLLLTALECVAAPALKEKNKPDSTLILGQWAQESLSLRGVEQQSESTTTFQFDADGACGFTNREGQINVATYSLDPQSLPRRMTWLHGPTKDKWLCLYEIVGDTLKLAFVDQGTEPPNRIEPAKNLTIYYLRRPKK